MSIDVMRSEDGARKALAQSREKALLARVGERVRAARAKTGLSRRQVCERASVSQRYLAQLEAGQGNISIALLDRIAGALHVGMDVLLSEAVPNAPELVEITERLGQATTEQRREILRLLAPREPARLRAQRVALIGLRGAGKSTLGRLAAVELGVPFLELNQEIEKVGGMPVEEIIALYGQEGYRHLEREALDQIVAGHERLILAVAGGIVSQRETFDVLLARYHAIWLSASPEEHMGRVRGQGDERPMAGRPDAMAQLRMILTEREAHYARAELHVDTSGKAVASSLADLVRAIERSGILGA